MKLLVIGSGAREHALVWRLARDAARHDIVCAPGNAGIESAARLAPVDAGDPEAVLRLAVQEGADLTVVGPELPMDTPYHWRLRVIYRPSSTPWMPASRWVTIPWNGWNETDFRTGGHRVMLPLILRNH